MAPLSEHSEHGTHMTAWPGADGEQALVCALWLGGAGPALGPNALSPDDVSPHWGAVGEVTGRLAGGAAPAAQEGSPRSGSLGAAPE